MLASLIAVAAALLHCAVADVPEAFSGRRTIVVCDQFTGLLKCPPGTLIDVQEAFYGRTSRQYCQHYNINSDTCSAGPRALAVARARCNNRQSCHTSGFGSLGDPCPGIYKYMRLTYTCRALSTAVACDDEGYFRINCPAGKYIWIREGFFGRVSDEHCNRGPRTDYKCSKPDAREAIAIRCNNRQSCIFPISFLGDPCFGTFKYTTAAYECLDHQIKVACDGSPDRRIQCPAGQTIRIHSGFFGRNTDEFCEFGPRHTYECSSPHAYQAIFNLCHGKPSCDLVLPIPDHCPGTLKMAIAKFTCA